MRRPGILSRILKFLVEAYFSPCSRTHYGRQSSSSGEIFAQQPPVAPRGAINPEWTLRFSSSRRRCADFRFLHHRRQLPNASSDSAAVSRRCHPFVPATHSSRHKSRRRHVPGPPKVHPLRFDRQRLLPAAPGTRRPLQRPRDPQEPPPENHQTFTLPAGSAPNRPSTHHFRKISPRRQTATNRTGTSHRTSRRPSEPTTRLQAAGEPNPPSILQ